MLAVTSIGLTPTVVYANRVQRHTRSGFGALIPGTPEHCESLFTATPDAAKKVLHDTFTAWQSNIEHGSPKSLERLKRARQFPFLGDGAFSSVFAILDGRFNRYALKLHVGEITNVTRMLPLSRNAFFQKIVDPALAFPNIGARVGHILGQKFPIDVLQRKSGLTLTQFHDQGRSLELFEAVAKFPDEAFVSLVQTFQSAQNPHDANLVLDCHHGGNILVDLEERTFSLVDVKERTKLNADERYSGLGRYVNMGDFMRLFGGFVENEPDVVPDYIANRSTEAPIIKARRAKALRSVFLKLQSACEAADYAPTTQIPEMETFTGRGGASHLMQYYNAVNTLMNYAKLMPEERAFFNKPVLQHV